MLEWLQAHGTVLKHVFEAAHEELEQPVEKPDLSRFPKGCADTELAPSVLCATRVCELYVALQGFDDPSQVFVQGACGLLRALSRQRGPPELAKLRWACLLILAVSGVSANPTS